MLRRLSSASEEQLVFLLRTVAFPLLLHVSV
jgi:hypothetical protein